MLALAGAWIIAHPAVTAPIDSERKMIPWGDLPAALNVKMTRERRDEVLVPIERGVEPDLSLFF